MERGVIVVKAALVESPWKTCSNGIMLNDPLSLVP